MSAPLLAFVAAIYAYVALEQWWHGSWSGFFIWASYACANIAFMWHTK